MRQSMSDRVLNQWLQEHARHHRVVRARLYLLHYLEPVRKTHSLDLEIRVQCFELFAQRYFLSRAPLSRISKERLEMIDHLRRSIRGFVGQLGDTSKRIEQKVGLQLQVEIMQLRLGELFAQLCGASLTFCEIARCLEEAAKHE